MRRVVDDVLSRPEYADLEPGLVARLRAWAAEQVGRVIEAIAGTGQAALIGWVLLAGAVLAAALLAVRFLRAVRPDPAAPLPVGGPVGRTAADWDADADDHERAGRHRDALRCRYRALLAGLAAAGVVDEIAGRTTGEYRQAVAAALPDAEGPFVVLTERFESAWYGDVPVSEDDLAAARDDAEAVRRAAGLATRRPAGAGAG